MNHGSLVKKLSEPKTPKAVSFMAEHGDTFVVEGSYPLTMLVRSVKTQKTMKLDLFDGIPYVNGEIINWEK